MPGIGGNIIIYIHVITTGYYMITWKAKTSLSYIQCTPPPAPRGPEPSLGALRTPKSLVLARATALSIPFSGRGPSAPVTTIGTLRLQQVGGVHKGQAVSTRGRECLHTTDHLAPIHG